MPIELSPDNLVGNIIQSNRWSIVVEADERLVRLIVLTPDGEPRGQVRVSRDRIPQLIELLIAAEGEQ